MGTKKIASVFCLTVKRLGPRPSVPGSGNENSTFGNFRALEIRDDASIRVNAGGVDRHASRRRVRFAGADARETLIGSRDAYDTDARFTAIAARRAGRANDGMLTTRLFRVFGKAHLWRRNCRSERLHGVRAVPRSRRRTSWRGTPRYRPERGMAARQRGAVVAPSEERQSNQQQKTRTPRQQGQHFARQFRFFRARTRAKTSGTHGRSGAGLARARAVDDPRRRPIELDAPLGASRGVRSATCVDHFAAGVEVLVSEGRVVAPGVWVAVASSPRSARSTGRRPEPVPSVPGLIALAPGGALRVTRARLSRG